MAPTSPDDRASGELEPGSGHGHDAPTRPIARRTAAAGGPAVPAGPPTPAPETAPATRLEPRTAVATIPGLDDPGLDDPGLDDRGLDDRGLDDPAPHDPDDPQADAAAATPRRAG